MPTTPRGVEYSDGSLTFPPGLGGVGGAFQTMAESIDQALVRNSLVLIDNMRTTSETNQATFSDIPDDYEDLILIWSGRMNDDPTQTRTNLGVNLNGDGGQNYSGGRDGLEFGAGWNTGYWSGSISHIPAGIVMPNNSGGWIHIPRYRRGVSKDAFGWGFCRNNLTDSDNRRFFVASGVWKNTAPVTSIRFWPLAHTFAPGMVASLYGTPGVA